jgi:uncharacterized membrane protein YeiB
LEVTEDFLITKLNAIASEIKHEDDLIGQRTTWLVMGQSFMFAAFASLIQQDDIGAIARGVKLMRILIPLVGLLMPVLVLLAVSAATYSTWRWRAEHDQLCKMLEAKGLEWPAVTNTTWVVVTGQLLPIAVALSFTVAWILILIRSQPA